MTTTGQSICIIKE